MFSADWVQFFLPSRIRLENNAISKIGVWLSSLKYQRAILLKIDTIDIKYGDEFEIIQRSIAQHLDGSIIYDELSETYTVDDIDSAVHFIRQCNANVIGIIGSAEAINLGKAIALLSTNRISAAELLQGNAEIIYDALPIFVVPIEPTMGEELASNFTLADKLQSAIVNISHESLIPQVCIYDPKLAIKLDKERATLITTSLFAYNIESSMSYALNPYTETLLAQSLTYIKETASDFCDAPYKAELVSNMFWASAFIGASINSTPLGITWGLAKVLHYFFEINFFHAQGILLPYIMEYHLTSNPQIFINIARALGENISELSKIEAAIRSVEAIKAIFYKMNMPSTLSQINFDKRAIPLVASLALKLPHIKHITSRKVEKEALETFLLAAI